MKPLIIKNGIFILLLLTMGTRCVKDENIKNSDFVIGYIVGSFRCWEIDSVTGYMINNKTPRGYCILLEGSANANSHWPMDYYTFNLPAELFDFPEEILRDLNGYECSPYFFPDSYRNKYKIRFKYRLLNEEEKVNFVCGGCLALGAGFPWENYKEISLDLESMIKY